MRREARTPSPITNNRAPGVNASEGNFFLFLFFKRGNNRRRRPYRALLDTIDKNETPRCNEEFRAKGKFCLCPVVCSRSWVARTYTRFRARTFETAAATATTPTTVVAGPSRVVRYDVRVEPTLTMLKRAGTKARPRDFFVAISREKFNLLNRREGQNSSTQWTAKKRRWKV